MLVPIPRFCNVKQIIDLCIAHGRTVIEYVASSRQAKRLREVVCTILVVIWADSASLPVLPCGNSRRSTPLLGCSLKQAQWTVTHVQVVANGEIADAPATAGNLADLLSLDADGAAEASATASSAVTALQDLLSGDLSAEVAAAGNIIWIFTPGECAAVSV